MDKKILWFVTIILLLLTFHLFAHEGWNFNSFTIGLNYDTLGSNENSPPDNLKLSKRIRAFTLLHSIFASMALCIFIAEDAIGYSLLWHSYNTADYSNSETVSNLKSMHIGLMLAGYSSYILSDIFAFIMFSTKRKHDIPINRTHVISSIITTSLFVIEIVSMILTRYAYENDLEFKKTMATLHGISCTMLTISIPIAAITIPIGRKRK